MSEMKYSALLERIIAIAKNIGNTSNPPLTAERFFVAVMDQLLDKPKEEFSAEYAAIREIMNKIVSDWGKTRTSLLDYIYKETNTTFLDDLYMKKRLQAAKEVVAQSNGDELQTVVLLSCILDEPSDAIRAAIFPQTQAMQESKKAQEASAVSMKEKFAQLFGQMEKDSAAAVQEQPETEQEEPRDVKTEMSDLVEDVKRIRMELQSCVYGQDNAIHVFTTGYFQSSMLAMLDKAKKRPRATFLFAGPPGVGKTFLAEKVAEALKLPFMRFDMSEYADKEANLEFCGADKVYKNAKAGNVTGFVAEHPKCVLLFDEIEKAHICVIHLFLQMLDAGRLRDNFTDREVSFSDAIIILTTNAGRQLYEQSESGDFSAVSRKVIVKALQNDINPGTGVPYFPGALCSRFASGNVVMFNHIGAHNLRQIARNEIRRQADNLEKETNISVDIDEQVYTALLFAEGSAADARTIRGRSETFFNDELYELLRFVASEKVQTNIAQIESIRICVDHTDAPQAIAELFVPAQKPQALLLGAEDTVDVCQTLLPDIQIHGVQDAAGAVELLKSRDISFAMLDMQYGALEDGSNSLNVEDVKSPARELFKFLKEQKKELPIYLLEESGSTLSQEEKISFVRQGVRGILAVTDREQFVLQLSAIVQQLHQQASMNKLAKENKLISFETAQSISADGKHAQIRLFDFEMGIAVDSEDAKNILSAVSKPNVKFADVIGAEDAKKELTYFVEYLKNPKKYMGTGVKAPKGVLLYGPPGTGKTMLAKAMACEAGVTFLAAEGNQFLKKYVGEGSEKVHELFRTARKYAPSVLFIDEIDAIAKERRGGANSGASGEETLTAFLTEMDGFVNDPSRPVFVLAATNFNVEPGTDKSLDAALMRRFDRRVYIDLPNREDRIRFLRMKIAKNPALDISDVQVDNVAMRATGMSLAELDSAVELALRSAIRDGSTKVTDAILEEAFETFNSGEVKKWDASQLERVARHEAGHTLLCWLAGETPSYVTIVARGNHGGYMQRAEQEGKAIYTKDELLARIRTSLGGRAAEIVYYGQRDGISTGASADLASATSVAQQIVGAYGMDDSFGLAVLSGAVDGAMSVELRTAVNRILQAQMEETIRLVSENKDKIDALVEQLLNKNQLNAAQIQQVFTQNRSAEASRMADAE